MKKCIIFIVFFCFGVSNVKSQILWDSLIEVKKLIKEDNNNAATTILNRIETDCINSNNDSLTVLFYESKGIILWEKGEYKDCIPYFQKAIGLYENLHIKAQNYLDAFVAIGFSYGRLGDYDNAERYYRKALLKSVAAKTNEDFRPNVYKNLGNLYMEKGDTLLAHECYKRASVKDVEAFDFMNMNYIEWETSCWEKIGQMVNEKQYGDAANFYSVFIKGIKTKKGNKDKSYLSAAYSRGILLSRYLNQTDEAIPLFQELVNLSDSIAESDENICGAYCNLALGYSRKGLYAMSDATIVKALPYLIRANNEFYPPHSIYRFSGNGAYWKQDYPNAIKYYEQYLSSSNKRESGSNYEEIVNQLSVSYILSGQPEKAQTLLNGFLKTDETRLKREDSPVLANVYHNLGRAYMLNGQTKEALAYLNKSKDLQLKLYGEVTERTTQYIQECSKK